MLGALLLATGVVLVLAPSGHAINFAVNQPANRQLGVPAWTSEAMGVAAKMHYGMIEPTGLAIDGDDSLYVNDYIVNRTARWGTLPAANAALFTNVFGKHVVAGSHRETWRSGCSAAGSHSPRGISVAGNSTTLDIVASDEWQHRVRIYTGEPLADGDANSAADMVLGQSGLTTCAGSNRGGAVAANTLYQPMGVWTDGVNRVAVADMMNHRVLLWTAWPAGNGDPADRVLGQLNMTTATPDNPGIALKGRLDRPTGVHFDGTYFYVVDQNNQRVLVWNGWPAANGAVANWVIGNGSGCADGGLANPTELTTRGSGATHQLVISDTENDRIAVLVGFPSAPADNKLFTYVIGQASKGVPCTANRGGLPAGNSLRRPTGVAFDSSGKLWVADRTNSRVLRFDTLAGDPSAARVLGQSVMTTNRALDIDNLLVAKRIGDHAAASWRSDVPAVAPDGTLLVSGHDRGSVEIWNGGASADNAPFDRRLGQVNRQVEGVNGTSDIVSQTVFDEPRGMWTDGTRLAITDQANNRVLIWTSWPSSDTDPPDHVVGQTAWGDSTGGTSSTRLSGPQSVTSDGIDLYVLDRGNSRVLIYRNFWISPPPIGMLATANVVLGQPNMTSGAGAGPSPTQLRGPVGISLAQDVLAVADYGNHRVVLWHAASTIVTNGAAATAVVGQANLNSAVTTTDTRYVSDVVNVGNALVTAADCQTSGLRIIDPIPAVGGATLSGTALGTSCNYSTPSQASHGHAARIAGAAGKLWVSSAYNARLVRWDDGTAPTITVAPTATVTCDGMATITWSTSESTTTEVQWDTVTRAWGAYAGSYVDPLMSGLGHSYTISFPTPGTKFVRVRGTDWGSNSSTPSGEINFTIPACPAPTTMLGDDVNAQGGAARANPSATNAPPILSTSFHTSWLNGSGVTMDRREAGTWSTPPEHAGAVWHLDSSNAADPNGQSTNAITWSGGQPYTAGRFGNAATFTANTMFGTVADHAELKRSNNFTFDLWFSTTTISNNASPIMAIKSDYGCGVGDTCNYSFKWNQGTNQLCAAFVNTSNTAINACRTATGLVDGQWHHAAMTVSATNALQLYVDGIPAGAPTPSLAPARTSTHQLAIGRPNWNAFHFRGKIDEVRFSPVAYDDAAILGYYRTQRPHLQQLWTSASTALGTNCTTATRCVDQVYAGASDILRDGARYWQRTRFNTLNNDYWTDWGSDWLEMRTTQSLTISPGSTIAMGMLVSGADTFGTSTIKITSNSAGGYQVNARDESDTWGLERTDAGASILDLQEGATPPSHWSNMTHDRFGITVRDATGGRLPKWGPAGVYDESDITTNNLYTSLENTTDVELHRRTTYSLTTDTILLTSRVNTLTTPPGNYDGQLTLTAIALP